MNDLRQIGVACCLILLANVAALAQEPQWERLSTTGKLVGKLPGGLQIATDKGDQWSVKLPNKAKDVLYMADADTEFLKPEMMVRFSATISNKGLVLSEISSLQVFTPLEASDVGITPEGGKSPADGLFGAEVKEEKKPKKGPEQTTCNVGGQIVSVKGRKMVVAAGGTQLKCELAENTKVTISVADLSWAKLGDKVEVDGRYLANNKAVGVQANSLSITAASPLVNSKKKPKPTTTKPDNKPEEKDAK